MLALALWRRSRPLLFAWFFLLISLLPVAFIGHYAAFFLYLPMAGWSLYAAELLAALRRQLMRLLNRLPGARCHAAPLESASVAALPLLLALFLAPWHWCEGAKTLQRFENAQPPTRQRAKEMLAFRPTLPRGARVLFIGDPFPKNDYSLVFLLRLLYGDMSIRVERQTVGQAQVDGRYNVVFRFRETHLVAATGHS